jgi:hypothetical protein
MNPALAGRQKIYEEDDRDRRMGTNYASNSALTGEESLLDDPDPP